MIGAFRFCLEHTFIVTYLFKYWYGFCQMPRPVLNKWWIRQTNFLFSWSLCLDGGMDEKNPIQVYKIIANYAKCVQGNHKVEGKGLSRGGVLLLGQLVGILAQQRERHWAGQSCMCGLKREWRGRARQAVRQVKNTDFILSAWSHWRILNRGMTLDLLFSNFS